MASSRCPLRAASIARSAPIAASVMAITLCRWMVVCAHSSTSIASMRDDLSARRSTVP